MKVVYLYDGTPYLAELNEEGEYDYPKEAWTETPPPEGIYEPFILMEMNGLVVQKKNGKQISHPMNLQQFKCS